MATLTTFSAGTKIKSGEVNDNFTNLNNQVKGYNTTDQTDHIVLTPGTSKFVKVAVLRQDDTTDAYKNTSVILTGWGFQLGAASAYMTEAVSFGIIFDAAPIVLASTLTFINGSDPTVISDFGTSDSGSVIEAGGITTGGFTALRKQVSTDGADPGNFNGVVRFGYSWIAIGELA